MENVTKNQVQGGSSDKEDLEQGSHIPQGYGVVKVTLQVKLPHRL